ncbi:DUF742 domain-containing protein [Actinosynnema sp. NPDC050436]|uniref:DUF742 domain-containing protein n=1 Tax=Actinosynnema sp. NPDC050436 TaxID=3155659 RepID=UPI0033EC6043
MTQDDGPDAERSFADLLDGFSLSGRRAPRRAEEPAPVERPTRPHPVFQDEQEFPREEAASSVRAYAWTGGRTTSSHQLEVETLVSAVDRDLPGALKSEYQEVVTLVAVPRSVAEVAALLRLPLGVAKVLLGDMAERGLVDVHGTASTGEPDLDLMERVLAGLRRL